MPSVSEQPAVSDVVRAERQSDQIGRSVTVSVRDVSITYRTALDRKANTLRQRHE